MKKINVIALLLASAAAIRVPTNTTTQSLAQSTSQSGMSLEEQDFQAQMEVFKQDQELSDDESDDDDDDDSLIAHKAENMKRHSHRHHAPKNVPHKKQHKTMPDKGMEHVDVNHKDATTSSEDDAALVMEDNMEEDEENEEEQ